jgi:hypothetical protein
MLVFQIALVFNVMCCSLCQAQQWPQAAVSAAGAKSSGGDADVISSFLRGGTGRPPVHQQPQQSRPLSAPSGNQKSAAQKGRPASSSSSARAETDSERALRRMHAFDEGSDDDDDEDDEDDDNDGHSDADDAGSQEDEYESDEEEADESRRHSDQSENQARSQPFSASHQQQRPSSAAANSTTSFPAKPHRDAASTGALSVAAVAPSSSSASGEASSKTRYGPVRVDRNAPRPQPYMRYVAHHRAWEPFVLCPLYCSP